MDMEKEAKQSSVLKSCRSRDVPMVVYSLQSCRSVEQGQHYFQAMVERHGVEPNDQLYCRMVDLLGCSERLDRAEQKLQTSGAAGNAGQLC